MQGQRSHLAQARKCHAKWQADLETSIRRPQNLFEGYSNDDNLTAEIGKYPAIDRDSNAG